MELKYVFKRPCKKCGEPHDTCLMNVKKGYILRRTDKCKKCLLHISETDKLKDMKETSISH